MLKWVGKLVWLAVLVMSVCATGSDQGWAQTATAEMGKSPVSAADTARVLISSALVLVMIVPGLALFYGGLVRSKNVLGTIMQSFAILCVVSLLWVLVGYSLAFGPDVGGLIGSFDWVGLSGVGLVPHAIYGPTIPHQALYSNPLIYPLPKIIDLPLTICYNLFKGVSMASPYKEGASEHEKDFYAYPCASHWDFTGDYCFCAR